MKIALLIDTLATGGAQRQIVNLTKALKSNGIYDELSLHYYHNRNEYEDDLKDIKRNIFCHYCGPKKFFKIISLFYLIKALYKYDVIITFLPNPSLIGLFIKLTKSKIKLIISERNSNSSEEYIKNSFLQNLIHKNTDFITTNSLSRYNLLNSKYPTKTFLIQNGYDKITYKKASYYKKNKKEINIILLGRISLQKNILGAIKAMEFFVSQYPENKINLEIFGRIDDQTYFSKCLNIAERFDKTKLIVKFRDVDNKWLLKVHKYDFLLLPSFYEGMSNVLIESMSAGLIVCCSNIPENMAIIGNWCKQFIFDPKDHKDIANSMKKILETSVDKINCLKDEGKIRFKERYSLTKLAENYISLLRR